MAKLPAYIGPAAFGLKMGVIVPGSNLLAMVAAIARSVTRIPCWMMAMSSVLPNRFWPGPRTTMSPLPKLPGK